MVLFLTFYIQIRNAAIVNVIIIIGDSKNTAKQIFYLFILKS